MVLLRKLFNRLGGVSLGLLIGLLLVIIIAAGLFAYFSDAVSNKTFAEFSVGSTTVVLGLTYFRRLSGRSVVAFCAVVAVLLVAINWLEQPRPKPNQYQAVFLSSNQIYFGHLINPEAKYPVLKDVYYLQSSAQSPQPSSDQTEDQLSLVKLGNEIHGPESEMILRGDQILLWENLKDSSKVVQTIKQAQNPKP